MKVVWFSRRSALLSAFTGMAAASRGNAATLATTCDLVVLTLAGSIGAPNRAAFDPHRDELFDNRGIAFEKARTFTLSNIMSLPQVSVRSFTDRGETSFTGVAFNAILDAAAPVAGAHTVRLTALDGFAADFPLAEIASQGWVLATSEQGKRYGIGDFGPFRWVRELTAASEWTGEEQQKWVHSIFYIEVTG